MLLVSDIQQSDSVMHMFFFIVFSLIDYYKLLNIVPWAVQQVLAVCLFFI